MGSPASISVVDAISIDVAIATVAAVVGIGQHFRHNPAVRYVCDAATAIVTLMSLTVGRARRECISDMSNMQHVPHWVCMRLAWHHIGTTCFVIHLSVVAGTTWEMTES